VKKIKTKLLNHFKNYQKKVIQNPYVRNMDQKYMDGDKIDNFQNDVLHLLKILYKSDLRDFITNKTIVDAGSGTGKYLTLLSAFMPKQILSVEPDINLLTEQITFNNCYFPFLPSKKICENIEFFNESMESFIVKNINFDTVFFFQNWHYMTFNNIISNTSADLVFYTKDSIVDTFDLYSFLNKNYYKIYKKITLDISNEYFFLIAKKVLDNP
jgi:hypothetical protein